MSESIPVGFCQCGCGEKTNLCQGEYSLYRRGHNNWKNRKRDINRRDVNPSGLCLCGCGMATEIAQWSDRQKGRVKGQHIRFIKGHYWRHRRGPDYQEEERGYETPCWVWRLDVNKATGYGRISIHCKTHLAHRLYYERYRGPIPQGTHTDHLCRVKLCVNPDHLEVVTPAENIRRGAAAKLTMEKANEIRRLRETTGMNYAEIGKLFGVSGRSVGSVVTGERWV